MAAVEAGAEVEDLLIQTEENLQRGLLEQAQQAATSALQRTRDPAALIRGYEVLIQADFQLERLTDLQGMLQQCGHQMHQLPLASVMLWGVVAVEFQEADAARETLGAYLEATQGRPAGMSREDAMALSRLYAVQLLAGLCQDFMAAASWLEAGGAGLSHEQQELLLLEVEEAEELLQEEHLAAWASTHAAAATDGGAADPAAHAAAEPAAACSELYRDADADAHSNAPCGTVCSTAASLSIADSAGGMLGFQSPPYADFQSNNVNDSGSNSSNEALQGLVNGLGPSVSCNQPAPEQQQRQQNRDSSSSGIDELAAAMDAAATAAAAAAAAGRALASAAQQQQQQQELLPMDQPGQQAAATEATKPATADSGEDDNPVCTITGLVDALEQVAPGQAGSAAAAAEAVVIDGAGSGTASSAAAAAVVPQPRTCALVSGASIDSASSSRARDQSSGGSCSSSKAAGAVAGEVAQQSGPAGHECAAAGSDSPTQQAEQQHPQQQPQQQQQQQSLMEWISNSSNKLWLAPAVQGTLHALHLQDLQPYEVVGGAALAGLVGYSVYRERRAIKKAAADLAAGMFQTAQMALGFTVVNPMGAVPGTQHMLR